MEVREASHLLNSIYRHKVYQGDAIRIAQIDYNILMLKELERIENYSLKYKEELMCLSSCIRRYLWKNNTERLYEVLNKLNIVINVLVDIFSSEEYWNLSTIVDYVEHLYGKRYHIGVLDEDIYGKIIDLIQIAGAKNKIAEKWSGVLESDNESKTFIEIFDDIFNTIEKNESEFIHPMSKTDVLYRMVKEASCNEDRFIPWPNKTQNRWNPPGKTYLYLSYGTEDTDYNKSLKVGQYICLLECKMKSATKACFCKFRPVNGGRILDLSYNDVELYSLRCDLRNKVNNYTGSMIDIIFKDESLLAHKYDQKKARNKIKKAMVSHPIDRSLLEKNTTKQLLKLICSCIYKKVDEKDDDAKEKAYKSFQFLAEYLENKGITGIIYPCTRTDKIKGKNIVLFNIHDAEPIRGSIVQYYYTGRV